MVWILGVCTVFGGVAALWFFWEKVTAWFARPTSGEDYERRIPLYTASKKIINSVFRAGDVSKDALQEYASVIDERKFLFGEDVVAYVNQIYDKGARLNSLRYKLNSPHGSHDERRRWAEDITEIELWFHDQIKHCPEVFKRYLRANDT